MNLLRNLNLTILQFCFLTLGLKKHLKRRLINYKFVQYITKLSNKRTKVIVSTDDEDYLNQITYAFHKSSEFTLYKFN